MDKNIIRADSSDPYFALLKLDAAGKPVEIWRRFRGDIAEITPPNPRQVEISPTSPPHLPYVSPASAQVEICRSKHISSDLNPSWEPVELRAEILGDARELTLQVRGDIARCRGDVREI